MCDHNQRHRKFLVELQHQVEHLIAHDDSKRALSMTFLDIESRTGKTQAAAHGLAEETPVVIATDHGRELGRCQESKTVGSFLRQLLEIGSNR